MAPPVGFHHEDEAQVPTPSTQLPHRFHSFSPISFSATMERPGACAEHGEPTDREHQDDRPDKLPPLAQALPPGSRALPRSAGGPGRTERAGDFRPGTRPLQATPL